MRIDVDVMLASSCTQYGVEPFDFDDFDMEGLSILADEVCSSARDHTDLLPVLAWITKHVAQRVLQEKQFRADPAMWDVPVAAPVFIIAPGRTGSTLLQWLLALEPSLRSPHLWELWHPMHGDDAASRRQGIERCEETLKSVSPAALRLHPMAAEAPDECHWLLRHNSIRAGLHRAPGYGDWLWTLDNPALTKLLKSYRQQVQILQAPDPSRHWLSKTFAHMHYWPVLFDVFPDARVIRIHRDPRQSTASCCSLMQHLARRLSPLMIADGNMNATVDGQRRMMAADQAAPSGQVIDVMFDDLRASPVTVARRLGQWLKLPDPEAFANRVERYMASAKRIRAAPHEPQLEDFGLTDHEVLDRFEAYIAWVRSRLDPSFCA